MFKKLAKLTVISTLLTLLVVVPASASTQESSTSIKELTGATQLQPEKFVDAYNQLCQETTKRGITNDSYKNLVDESITKTSGSSLITNDNIYWLYTTKLDNSTYRGRVETGATSIIPQQTSVKLATGANLQDGLTLQTAGSTTDITGEPNVVWYSDNTSVATIYRGSITATGKGTTTIYAIYGNSITAITVQVA